MLVWLSIDTWFISLLAIGYLTLLFFVAYWGQKQSAKQWLSRPWIYSLSLGVSFTSWTYYGMVGQVAESGAMLAPVFIGTISCFMLAWPMLMKILRISKEQNITSIADFIACRYDRSPKIAATVAVIALLGTIPYIALQLRAVSTSFDLLTGSYQSGISTTFAVTIVLIGFSILFGTRQIAASKQNQGLVFAIAFSSIVKLLALTTVGVFVTFYLFDGFGDIYSQRALLPQKESEPNYYLPIAQALLGAATIFILPQQFHMMVIENHHENELKKARWLYPLFIVLINIFVLPIAIAGQLTFPGGSVDADTFVLTMPLYHQQAWLGIVAFIGGLAAAVSMVIIASIVISTMVVNELITPALIRTQLIPEHHKSQFSRLLLILRRFAIAVILLAALGFELIVNRQSHLASIGLLSFVLLAQFAPCVVGALYWRKATTKAALYGLVAGSITWVYTLFIPTLLPDSDFVSQGLFAISWLKPTALFGIEFLDNVSHGVFLSLAVNIICYVGISIISHRSVGEKLQAEIFIEKSSKNQERPLKVVDLYHLLYRFTNELTAKKFIDSLPRDTNKQDIASHELIEYAQTQLSGVLGSASTRMVMKAAITSEEVPLEDVVSIVDEASQLFQFNRELLQAGVENIEQGISVVDSDMRLVAWNNRYLELLEYPAEIVTAGRPIEDLIRFNIERGVIKASENIDEQINRRIEYMRAGNSHHFQRTLPNGVVVEIRGQSMPGGGFVSTFSDITAHINAEKALKVANESLEKRVESRTKELAQATAEAQAAHSSKTRFLAAASHDLMQPFNALSLFTSMLKQKVKEDELKDLASHIEGSLNVVEGLLSDLVEISRLDASTQKVEKESFAIDELLSTLTNEFSVIAKEDNIKFNYQFSSCYVETDQRMLRRIIQNFLSNAFHYCPEGATDELGKNQARVTLGVRHSDKNIRIEVWDNGPGIPRDKQAIIFQEFERLEQTREVPGLGLGLAISDRIAKLLGLKIAVYSSVGKGTCFSVEIPRVFGQRVANAETNEDSTSKVMSSHEEVVSIPILLIDNDELMLTAMSSQLEDWGCIVIAVKDLQSARNELSISGLEPKLIIADYHLDDDCNGVDVAKEILTKLDASILCVICSADPSESVRQHTSSANFDFVRKPIKALALKRLVKQVS